MDGAAREAVLVSFAEAAARAAEAGVDVLLLDMADGYLLASFLSPLTNPGEERAAYPLDVLRRGAGGRGRPTGRWPFASWPTTGSAAG